MKSYTYTDAATIQGIDDIYEEFNYIACPHTAIAWLAIQDYYKQYPDADDDFVFLSTAHPCKFPEVFTPEIAAKIEIPEQVEELNTRPKNAVPMAVDFETFKAFLLV